MRKLIGGYLEGNEYVKRAYKKSKGHLTIEWGTIVVGLLVFHIWVCNDLTIVRITQVPVGLFCKGKSIHMCVPHSMHVANVMVFGSKWACLLDLFMWGPVWSNG